MLPDIIENLRALVNNNSRYAEADCAIRGRAETPLWVQVIGDIVWLSLTDTKTTCSKFRLQYLAASYRDHTVIIINIFNVV